MAEGIPCVEGAELGVAYRFTLYTHCGVVGTYFDGRWWQANPPQTDGSGNPSPGWGNPQEFGLIQLVSPGFAAFQSDDGLVAYFRPAERNPYDGCK